MTKPTLYIIRGLPGSGKSTLAKELLEKDLVQKHVEADHFMTDGQGNYKFNPALLQKCHEECQAWTWYYLTEGYDTVVANTFTRIWEMSPYFKMGFPFHVIEAKGDYKNIHNVPPYTIKQMKNRWQDYKYA